MGKTTLKDYKESFMIILRDIIETRFDSDGYFDPFSTGERFLVPTEIPRQTFSGKTRVHVFLTQEDKRELVNLAVTELVHTWFMRDFTSRQNISNYALKLSKGENPYVPVGGKRGWGKRDGETSEEAEQRFDKYRKKLSAARNSYMKLENFNSANDGIISGSPFDLKREGDQLIVRRTKNFYRNLKRLSHIGKAVKHFFPYISWGMCDKMKAQQGPC